MGQKIVILDGYSLMYRAYHALQTPMSAPDGTPTNAIHGFVMMLLKVIEDERPDALAVAFDMHAPTFRHDMFDGYKATRKPMPDDLRAQDPIIRELIERPQYPAPKFKMNPDVKNFYDFTLDDFAFEDYQAGPQVKKIPVAV